VEIVLFGEIGSGSCDQSLNRRSGLAAKSQLGPKWIKKRMLSILSLASNNSIEDV